MSVVVVVVMCGRRVIVGSSWDGYNVDHVLRVWDVPLNITMILGYVIDILFRLIS